MFFAKFPLEVKKVYCDICREFIKMPIGINIDKTGISIGHYCKGHNRGDRKIWYTKTEFNEEKLENLILSQEKK